MRVCTVCTLIFFLGVFLNSSLNSSVLASEIRIEGNRVVVTDDNGETIDTANLPKGEEVKGDDTVEITEKGLEIGSVKNTNGEMKNVSRSTKLENVTIINNGKARVYNKKD